MLGKTPTRASPSFANLLPREGRHVGFSLDAPLKGAKEMRVGDNEVAFLAEVLMCV